MHVFIDFICMLFILNIYIYIFSFFYIYCKLCFGNTCNNCHANKAHIEFNFERERERERDQKDAHGLFCLMEHSG